MFSSKIQKIIKFPILILTIWVLLFGFICIEMFHKDSIETKTVMANPALIAITDQESCCNTTMSQHIQHWNNIFLTVPQGVRDTLIFLALGLTLILVHSWFSFRGRYHIDPDIELCRLYIRENPNIVTFNHLKLVFACGILNPKLY